MIGHSIAVAEEILGKDAFVLLVTHFHGLTKLETCYDNGEKPGCNCIIAYLTATPFSSCTQRIRLVPLATAIYQCAIITSLRVTPTLAVAGK
jgi:hypothetical protein